MSIVVDIEKRFPDFQLKVQFSAEHEVLALLGASGCGKTLTLRCIAGLERPDRGHIEVDGRVLYDSGRHIDLPPQQRRTGLLFQNFALFPNMTVLENLRAVVRDRHSPLPQQMLARFALTGLEQHYPNQLSGGQQQRAALARLMLCDPAAILLDEPFSSLDQHLRFRLEQQLRELLQEFGKTAILVSHNRDEVFRLCSTIAVMQDGRIERIGEKHDVFQNPVTKNAAILTGCKNISPIRVLSAHRIFALDWGLELTCARDMTGASHVGIRMHDISADGRENRIACRICCVTENPFSVTRMLKPLAADAARPIGWETSAAVPMGQQIEICLPPQALLPLHE